MLFDALIFRLAVLDDETCTHCCTTGRSHEFDVVDLANEINEDALLDFLKDAAADGETQVFDPDGFGEDDFNEFVVDDLVMTVLEEPPTLLPMRTLSPSDREHAQEWIYKIFRTKSAK